MPDNQTPHVSIADIVARLEQSRRSLMEAISGLDEEGFRARPQQGGWTAAETLAHLLITERNSTGRARTALAEDNPQFAWVGDEQLEEQARSAQRMPVPQIVHGLLAQRRDTLHLLERLSPDELSRRFHHQRWGEQSVGGLFQHIADHEEEHAGQIRAQLVLPGKDRRNREAADSL